MIGGEQMKYVVLTMILMPFVELYFILSMGDWIGVLPTIILLVGIGVLGAYISKVQGINAYRKLQFQLQNGEMPGETIVDGLCILVTGILFVLPGFLSDIVAILFLVPPFKTVLKGWIMQFIRKQLANKRTITIIR